MRLTKQQDLYSVTGILNVYLKEKKCASMTCQFYYTWSLLLHEKCTTVCSGWLAFFLNVSVSIIIMILVQFAL